MTIPIGDAQTLAQADQKISGAFLVATHAAGQALAARDIVARVTEKADLLRAWDGLSARLEAEVPGVPLTRYGELTAYHRQNEPILEVTLGEIDNEIHHRGQATVYLRLLGIKPPDFWER